MSKVHLFTHKLSQDHVENFFGCIRGRGGFNNNPTAAQFMASYRRLLIQTEVKSSNSGNCSQDMESILTESIIVPEEDAASTVTETRRAPITQPEDHITRTALTVLKACPFLSLLWCHTLRALLSTKFVQLQCAKSVSQPCIHKSWHLVLGKTNGLDVFLHHKTSSGCARLSRKGCSGCRPRGKLSKRCSIRPNS